MSGTALHRITLLPELAIRDGIRILAYPDRYRGRGSHALECGSCGCLVASGVDPRRYPAMFSFATHIECPRCSSLNILPPSL